MAPVRGSWEIHEAIVTRWSESGLDDSFLEEYESPGDNKHSILSEREAEPDQTGPYCVFEILQPTIDGNSSGKTKTDGVGGNTEESQQYLDFPVQFRIICKSSDEESGKDIAIRLAKKVAETYKPANKLPMPGSDQLILTTQTGDYSVRTGDQVWEWFLFYNYKIDATYDLPV